MPSPNAAGEDIHQHGQVPPLRREPDIGDVPTPDLMGLAGGELFEQMGIGSQPATRVGRAHRTLDWDLEPFLPHDPLDAFMVDDDPASPPFFRHATVAYMGGIPRRSAQSSGATVDPRFAASESNTSGPDNPASDTAIEWDSPGPASRLTTVSAGAGGPPGRDFFCGRQLQR